jgi:hypothetical protein
VDVLVGCEGCSCALIQLFHSLLSLVFDRAARFQSAMSLGGPPLHVGMSSRLRAHDWPYYHCVKWHGKEDANMFSLLDCICDSILF